jgi:hypothetical protein
VHRSSCLRTLVAGATLTLLVPSRALAQTASTPPPNSGRASAPAATATEATPGSEGVRAAQEHLGRALEHYRAHRYVEAIHEFELANRAAPSADLWYNIARSHELLSHHDEAVDYYRRYLRDKVNAPDRADVERRIAELERLAEQQRAAARRQDGTARIRFDVATPGATVFLGDRTVGSSPLTEALAVEPGTYPLRVTAPGMQEWRGSVRARRGETVTAFVTPQPATEYRTRAGGHLLSYILGGAGFAALGTGVGFGVYAAGLPQCTWNSGGMFDPCGRREAAFGADVAFGIGAGLLLTSVITYFIEAGNARTERVERPAPVREQGSAARSTETPASAPAP